MKVIVIFGEPALPRVAESRMGWRQRVGWPVGVLSQSTAKFPKSSAANNTNIWSGEASLYKPYFRIFSPCNESFIYFRQKFFGITWSSLMNCFSQMSLTSYQKIWVICTTCSRGTRLRQYLLSTIIWVFLLLGVVHWWKLLTTDM